MSSNFSFGGDGSIEHVRLDTRTGGKWVTCTVITKQYVLLGYDDDVGLVQIDLASGRVSGRYQGEIRDSVRAMALVPGSSKLIVACADGKLLRFDVEDRSHERTVQHASVGWSQLIVLSESNIAGVDDKGKLYVIDVRSLQITSTAAGAGFVDCYATDTATGTLWCGGRSPSIGTYQWNGAELQHVRSFEFDADGTQAFTGLHYCPATSALFILSERGYLAVMKKLPDGGLTLCFDWDFEDWCYFVQATSRDLAFTTRESGALKFNKQDLIEGNRVLTRRQKNRSEGRIGLSPSHLFYVDDETDYMMGCLLDRTGRAEDLRLFEVGRADLTCLEWNEFGLVACANTDDVWLLSRNSLTEQL